MQPEVMMKGFRWVYSFKLNPKLEGFLPKPPHGPNHSIKHERGSRGA